MLEQYRRDLKRICGKYAAARKARANRGPFGHVPRVRELQMLLRFFHDSVPAREPVLDIWAELAPKVAAWEAEERLGAAAKVRLRSHRFLHNVAAGAILFTQALAMNTEAHMHKYLMGDSLQFAGGSGGNNGLGRGKEAR